MAQPVIAITIAKKKKKLYKEELSMNTVKKNIKNYTRKNYQRTQ